MPADFSDTTEIYVACRCEENPEILTVTTEFIVALDQYAIDEENVWIEIWKGGKRTATCRTRRDFAKQGITFHINRRVSARNDWSDGTR